MISQRFQQIEDIYQSLNVYRSLIVYDDKDEFLPLKELLMQNDYPITTGENCRMYTFDNKELDFSSNDIHWNTINLVVCLDDVSFDYVKEHVDEFTNLILLIKI